MLRKRSVSMVLLGCKFDFDTDLFFASLRLLRHDKQGSKEKSFNNMKQRKNNFINRSICSV